MMLKPFRVRMWNELSDTEPSEDITLDVSTHHQALDRACRLLCIHHMEWVEVDEPQGYVMQFLDVSLSPANVLEYEASYRYAVSDE